MKDSLTSETGSALMAWSLSAHVERLTKKVNGLHRDILVCLDVLRYHSDVVNVDEEWSYIRELLAERRHFIGLRNAAKRALDHHAYAGVK